ncbi:HAD-IA family hydrolase [Pseudooceanicola onchidii]|uniref:HAD-IA family hydrolase n=1 Tax=Pseudooceanicola onchidii TaxID=2562279 RepID=UPI0010AA452C|nr:HAD-IA family hydrolase [Pseudooceanicola onchidii]
MRLVIFDVDGTLVDSQGDIVASMTAAFEASSLPVPPRAAILGIVGLSLPRAMAQLAPEAEGQWDRMVEDYKASYQRLRVQNGATSSPLYPGIREVIDQLAAEDETLLAIATGKSRRGLLALLDNHGWQKTFVSLQVADDHPSKPHPSMLHAALTETGMEATQAVMIGDTTYDMEMAAAAGVGFIGVGWGYHAPAALTGAREIVGSAGDLLSAITRATGASA